MKLHLNLQSDQEEKLLRMFEHYFKDKITNEKFPLFENGNIIYSETENPIHWYEVSVNVLPRKVFANKFYWLSVFYNKCVTLYNEHQPHPVEFLYDAFEKILNDEPLSFKSDNDFVIQLEEKEKKKTEKQQQKREAKKSEKVKETKKETKVNAEDDLWE